MKSTKITSITAALVIVSMIAGCATPNGSASMAQGDPCQPNAAQSSFSPTTTSFIQQAILSPLANIGGTLLATAAANYSGKYSGKLNKLLVKLVTPKKKKKKEPLQQPVDQGYPYGDPGYGYENQIDPNTGYPVQDPYGQTDPYAQPQGQDPYGQTDPYGQPQGQDPYGQTDPYGQPQGQDPYGQTDPYGQPQGQDPYAQTDPYGQTDPNLQGEIQPRGVPGQQSHATFPSEPCNPQQQVQGYPPASQPYGNNPAYQSGGYDPYAQQQGQNPYGQTDPYAQQGYPQDPYAQQPAQQDPYAQQAYPNDSYNQQEYPTAPNTQQGYPQDPYAQQPAQQDPYAQQGYPQDPYGQQPAQQDPYAQQQGQNPYGQTDPYAQPGYAQDPYGQQPAQQDPYAQQGYTQDTNSSTGYSTAPGAIGAPIGLDVVMVKQTMRNGAAVMVPLQDGDALKDGRGNAKAGDKFRIMFRPHTDGYVYVVAIDGSGWAQGIFPPPTSPLANPVKAGEQYILPEGNNWFSLDQFKGVETIFFVASQEKRQDLEEVLQSITGHERPATETPQQVTKVAMVPYGVGGARPSTKGFNLPEGSGANQTIMPTSYFSKTAGEDLRLTRWFLHE